MLDQPGSAAAESMRALMGLILLTSSKSKAKVVLVASPLPGDGKTTVAYNLALSLAEKGPTCFIDADLRKRNEEDVNGIFSYYRNNGTGGDIETPSGDSQKLMCVNAGTGPENPISILVSASAGCKGAAGQALARVKRPMMETTARYPANR